MTIRQISDLVEGSVVSQHEYQSEAPQTFEGVMQLVLARCTDFMNREGIPVEQQQSMVLEKVTLRYPRMAGYIEVIPGDPDRR